MAGLPASPLAVFWLISGNRTHQEEENYMIQLEIFDGP